jgi:hypothetical protein
MYIGLQVKYRLLLSDLNETGIFSIDFSGKKYTNVNENLSGRIRVVPCGMAGRRTDRKTDGNDEPNSGFSLNCGKTLGNILKNTT